MTLVHNGTTLRGTIAQGWALAGSVDSNVQSRGTMRPVGIALDVVGAGIVQTGAPSASFSISTYVADSTAWYNYAALIVRDITDLCGKVGALQIVDGTTTVTIAANAMLTGISLASSDQVAAKSFGINFSFTIAEKGSNNMTLLGMLRDGGFECIAADGVAPVFWNPSGANAGVIQRVGTESIGSGDCIAWITYHTTAGTIDSNIEPQLFVHNQITTNKYIRYSWDVALENLGTSQTVGKYAVSVTSTDAVIGKASEKTMEIVSGMEYRHSITVAAGEVYSDDDTKALYITFTAVTSAADEAKIYIDNVQCEELYGEAL